MRIHGVKPTADLGVLSPIECAQLLRREAERIRVETRVVIEESRASVLEIRSARPSRAALIASAHFSAKP